MSGLLGDVNRGELWCSEWEWLVRDVVVEDWKAKTNVPDAHLRTGIGT